MTFDLPAEKSGPVESFKRRSGALSATKVNILKAFHLLAFSQQIHHTCTSESVWILKLKYYGFADSSTWPQWSPGHSLGDWTDGPQRLLWVWRALPVDDIC